MIRAALFLLLALLTVVARADDTALPNTDDPKRLQLRVHLEPEGTLVQGETARLVVDLLTPEFFHEAPTLPTPRIEGLYVALTDENAAHPVVTIDGANWSGISRVYLVTPLSGGRMTIPSFQVSVSLGANGDTVTAMTPPVPLRVQALPLPPGVTEALIASDVKVSQAVAPDKGGLRVGDSVTRRIVITADGAPAMMIPPLAFPPIHGLTTYAAPAQTRNAVGDQGGFMGGERTESVSYVIQERGHYTLPPVTVRWMDVQTHQWRESTVPAVKFHAWWGAPAQGRFGVPGQGPVERAWAFLRSDLGIALVVLVALGVAAWWFRAHLRRAVQSMRERRERHRQSESVAFHKLMRLRHSSDADRVYRAVDDWLRRCARQGEPGSLDAWIRRYGDDGLRLQSRELLARVYGEESKTADGWTAQPLLDALKAARQRRHTPPWRRRVDLPPLNPV
ncbi:MULTISPECIES: BatD family protein [Dyella]|uniref:DUF7939 domain-containing protein n=2 Tax=Dyella TaxID=231454 RepID=A0A4R0YJ38_9GAMM|nr:MULTISPECIES: BatD family protein [Dyella]TBR35983.1 hypothetical protein EYV96_18545 [Dyella terrae]TCI08470.1 hypothetical protein EZM97_28010 [Dyella soli]